MNLKLLFIFLIFLSLILKSCEIGLDGFYDQNPYSSYRSIELSDGRNLFFALITPEIYKENQEYPVLVTFPPGYQTKNEVLWEIDKYWITESIKRNWIVISPVAPDSILFHKGSTTLIPELFDWIQDNYNVEGNKFHLAGVSNGGISAFQEAIRNSDRVRSLTVFPGYPLSFNSLRNLEDIPIRMFVGAEDTTKSSNSLMTFMQAMDTTKILFDNLNADSIIIDYQYHKLTNEGMTISSLESQDLFDILDGYRNEE